MADAGKSLTGGATLAAGIATGNPMAMIGGGIGLLGGLLGSGGDDEAAAAAAARAEQTRLINELGMPPEEAKAVVLEKYKSAGTYTPAMEAAMGDDITSKVAGIEEAPGLRGAQMSALETLQKTGRTGMGAQERADINKMRQESERDTQARMQSIQQAAQMRGETGGGGSDLAAQMLAAQSGAERMSAGGERVAASAGQKALEAMVQSGQLGGNIRGQDFSQAVTKGTAADEMNRFKTQNQIARQQRNIAAQNVGAQANLENAQIISNINVGQANKEALRQRTAEGTDFTRKLDLAKLKSGAAGEEATRQTAASNAAAQGQEKLWQGVGNLASEYGGKGIDMFNLSPKSGKGEIPVKGSDDDFYMNKVK